MYRSVYVWPCALNHDPCLRLMPMTASSIWAVRKDAAHALPLFLSRVSAGFPSPADDYVEGTLDLNEHLIQREAATFFVRASGHSMTGAGIYDGDILVVDRSKEPTDGAIVIAAVDGELTVKRYCTDGGRPRLVPESEDHEPIFVGPGQELRVWGVVQHVIHDVS